VTLPALRDPAGSAGSGNAHHGAGPAAPAAAGQSAQPGHDQVAAGQRQPAGPHPGQPPDGQADQEPPLLPSGVAERARVRAIALAIACDIHPLDNTRVLKYLVRTVGATEEMKDAWYRHWIDLGLKALETQLSRERATGEFCHGDSPTLADCCLVPQLANARRANIPLDAYPTLTRIETRCEALRAFAAAAPHAQPDAE